MRVTLRALTRKVTLVSAAFILAISTLTATVPFILSQNASAATLYYEDFSSGTGNWNTGGGAYGSITNAGGYAIVDEVTGAIGPYSWLDKSGSADISQVWTGDYKTSIDVYLDPAWANGSGFEWSVASASTSSYHKRDFIAHVVKDSSTKKLIFAASNNSNYVPKENLESGDHFEVTSAGWYKIQHEFRDNGGVLAVDISLVNSSGTKLYTITRSDPSDLIPSTVGGHGYAWFTDVTIPGGLSIDNIVLTTVDPDTERPTVSFLNPSSEGQAFRGNLDVKFQADDNDLLSVVTVNIKDQFNSGHLGTCGSTSGLSVASYTLNCTINTTNFADGTYYLRAGATDASGNNQTISRQVIFDNKRPTNTITYPLASSTQPDNFTITGVATDATSGVDYAHVWVTKYNADGSFGGYVVSEDVPVDASGNYQLPVTLPHNEGPHGYRVHSAAYDKAGNSQNTEKRPVYVDAEAPDVSLVSPTNGAVVKGASLTQSWTSTSTDVVKYIYESWHDEAQTNLRWHEEFSSAVTSKTATNVADATFWWQVTAVDAIGNETKSPLWKLVVDNTAPTVSIDSPTGTLFNTDVQVRGTVTDNNLRHYWVHITRNGTTVYDQVVPSTGITNALLYTAVDEGDYVVTLAARDTAGGGYDTGNRSADVVKSFTIDKTAPIVTVTPVPGSWLRGTVTFDITVTDANLNPSAPLTWVYLYNNAPPQKSKGANVDLSSGHGTFTVDTTLLADGLSTFNVGKLYDAAGNASGVGDTYFKNYKIDNTTPIITVDTLFTTDSTPVLTGHVDDTTATVVVKIGSHTYPTIVDTSTGNWTAQVSPSLSDGHYDVVATATDPAGNIGYDSTTNELTVDAHIPNAPVLLLPAPNGYSNNSNTLFTWLGPLFVMNGPVTTNLQVATDLAFANIVVDTTGSASNFQFNTLADGVYYTRINSTDNLGGTSSWSTTRKFTVDTVDPVVTITTPVNNEAVRGTVALTGTATDLNPSSYRWTILNSSNAIVYINTTFSDTVSPYNWDTTSVADGTYTVYLRATDSALNSVVTSVQVTVDNTAPTVPVLLSTANNGYETSNDFYFTWTASTDAPAVTYEFQSSGLDTVDGDGSLVGAWNSITHGNSEQNNLTTPEIHSTGAPDGTYYWQVRAIDALGNKSAWTAPWKMTIDSEAPEISFTASTYTFTGLPTVQGSVNDPTATLKLIVNGGTPIDITNIVGTGWVYAFTTALADGTYDLELVAKDPAGHTAFKTATLVIATPEEEESTTTTTPPPSTATVTPTTAGTPTPAAQGVLGASTENTDTDTNPAADTDVEGVETFAATTDTDNADDGTIWGLAWYWWLLILAALGAIIWWIISAFRNRATS